MEIKLLFFEIDYKRYYNDRNYGFNIINFLVILVIF